MKIAVWCGAECGTNPAYAAAAEALGRAIGEGGHELVYGGSRGGLMGAVADAALAAGARVTGVTVDIPRIIARRHEGLTECVMTPDLATRKQAMIGLADAFVALPGGVGTLDEIGDVLSLIRAGVCAKRIALYSVEGFYASLAELFGRMEEDAFTPPELFGAVLVSDDLAAIMAFLGEGQK